MRHESVRVLLGAFVYKTQDKGKINNDKDSGKKLRDLKSDKKDKGGPPQETSRKYLNKEFDKKQD